MLRTQSKLMGTPSSILHVFQKKSKSGRETPRRDMELIKQRMREAEQIAKEM